MKTVIDRSNYESFFLDYHEGRLDASQRRLVLRFLELHPDLKEEFDAFETIRLDSVILPEFPGKEKLKKKVPPSETVIAYMENDLSPAERIDFEKQDLQFEEVQKELALFRRTLLVPDEHIRFSNRDSLKRKAKIIVFPSAYRYASIAAVLLIFLLTYVFYQRAKENPELAHQPAQELPHPVPKQAIQDEKKNSASLDKKYESNQSSVQHSSPQSQHRVYIRTSPERKTQLASIASPNDHRSQEVKPDVPSSLPSVNQLPVQIDPVNAPKTEPTAMVPESGSVTSLPANTKTLASGRLPLSEVFTADEMKELGLTGKKDDSHTLWKLAQAGAKELQKVSGKEVKLEHEDELSEQRSFAMSIGNFSVRRNSAR